MSKTMEKIKIDPETFANVSKMLTSVDDENVSTALMAMEQMDFRKGTMCYALLYKESMSKQTLWKEHAPNLLANLEKLGIDNSWSYRSIWNEMKKKASKEEKQLFVDRFGPIAGDLISKWGFKDMLKDMTITIKLKEDGE